MFDSYAIIELMGHARIAGKAQEVTMLGTTLLRVDVPKTAEREGYTKYFAPNAVYCITPTDEPTAIAATERFNEPAIQPWILPSHPILAARVNPESGYADDDSHLYDADYEDDIHDVSDSDISDQF